MFKKNQIVYKTSTEPVEAVHTSRNIPEPMKRAIRQRCGFGCVLCGSAPYDYHHMIKEWAEVKQHVEDDITLLCLTHHREAHSLLITKEQVVEANLNPHNLKENQTSPYLLNFAGKTAVVVIANNVFTNEAVSDVEGSGGWSIMIPILIDDIPVIGFLIEDDHLLLNAALHDEFNEPILVIRHNQLIFKPDTWDVYIKGNTLFVREAPRQILLELQFCPPNKVIVKRAKIRVNGVVLELKDDHLILNGEKTMIFTENHFSAPVGLSIGYSDHFPAGGAMPLERVNRYTRK